MKHYPILFFVASVILLFSCNIQKRHYRPGFYIPQTSSTLLQHSKQTAGDDNLKPAVVKNDEPASEQSMQQHIDSSTNHTVNIIHPVKEHYRSPHTFLFLKKSSKHTLPNIKKDRYSKHQKTYRNSIDDTLVIIGVVLMLIGLAFFLIGVGIMKGNPLLSNTFMILGAVFFCLGLIIGIIGDPSIIFDVLFAFLDAI